MLNLKTNAPGSPFSPLSYNGGINGIANDDIIEFFATIHAFLMLQNNSGRRMVARDEYKEAIKTFTSVNLSYTDAYRLLEEFSTNQAVLHAYPVPATGTITVEYNLSMPSEVTITLYNSAGQQIKSLFQGQLKEPGHFSFSLGNEDNMNQFGNWVFSPSDRTLYLSSVSRSRDTSAEPDSGYSVVRLSSQQLIIRTEAPEGLALPYYEFRFKIN